MTGEMVLYSFGDQDRSGKVRWTAAELGYEVQEKRMEPGAHKGAEYLAINPYGQIPTAVIDGEAHYESLAICLSLAERHPDSGLIPSAAADRERFWRHLCAAAMTLENDTVIYFLSKLGIADPRWQELVRESLDARLPVLAAELGADDWIVPGGFTLADIQAGYVLRIAVQAGLLERSGRVAAYLERLMARPAAREARVFASVEN